MVFRRVATWPGRISHAAGRVLPSNAGRYVTPRMITMLLIVGLVLVLVFGFILGRGALISYFIAHSPPPVQTVATVRATETVWQPQLKAVGSLHAVNGADLASEVAGLVTKIGFHPGEDVKAGTLLIQLRDDSDRAQLAANRAAAELAAQTFARDAALIKTNAISKTEYDTALANMNGTRAQADAQAAIVEKKAIRAPYDGRVGIRQVDVGQYVNAGTTLVTLQQLDPIYVDFDEPQQKVSQLKPGGKVTLSTDAVPGKVFSGHIVAFDPQVDPATRNVHVRAEIGNPDKLLLPGMFADVVVDVGHAQKLITLPQTALSFNPYGDVVFVVVRSKDKSGKETLSVEQRFVVIGETRGDQVAILRGVTPNDEVVNGGQMKLKNGTPVKIDNSVSMPNNPAPTPQEDQ